MNDSSENLSPRVGADRNDLPDPTMGVPVSGPLLGDTDDRGRVWCGSKDGWSEPNTSLARAHRSRRALTDAAAEPIQDRSPVTAARRVTKAEVDEADERGAMQINIMNASLKHGGRKLWTSADFRRLRVMLQVLEQSARGSDAEGFAGTSIGAVQSTYDATLNAVASALGVVPQE